jgi:hypothetical protein
MLLLIHWVGHLMYLQSPAVVGHVSCSQHLLGRRGTECFTT